MVKCIWSKDEVHQFVYVTQYLGFAQKSVVAPLFDRFTKVQFRTKIDTVKGLIQVVESDFTQRLLVLNSIKLRTYTDEFVKILGLKTIEEIGVEYETKKHESKLEKIDIEALKAAVALHKDPEGSIPWDKVCENFPGIRKLRVKNRWTWYQRCEKANKWDKKTKEKAKELYSAGGTVSSVAEQLNKGKSECHIVIKSLPKHLKILSKIRGNQENKKTNQAEQEAALALSTLKNTQNPSQATSFQTEQVSTPEQRAFQLQMMRTWQYQQSLNFQTNVAFQQRYLSAQLDFASQHEGLGSSRVV